MGPSHDGPVLAVNAGDVEVGMSDTLSEARTTVSMTPDIADDVLVLAASGSSPTTGFPVR